MVFSFFASNLRGPMPSVDFFTFFIILCGVHLAKSDIQSRIIGGEDAPDGAYPYMASLQYSSDGVTFSYYCGGSLIRPNWAITAAHCVANTGNLAGHAVLAGSNSREAQPPNAQRSPFTKIVVSPGFQLTSNGAYNDTALVKFAPFDFTLDPQHIGQIELASEFIGPGVLTTLTGWGKTFPTFTLLNDVPIELQRVTLHTITNDQCNARGLAVTSTALCTYERFGKGPCGFDSGSPLTAILNGVRKLIGTVSYGYSSSFCARGRPDVHSRISAFVPWINDQIATQ